MTLHIFNPEHEMAMACGGRHINLPHTIQELRMNMGWMPALWAHDGDIVLVDDKAFAIKAAGRHEHADVLFLEPADIQGQRFDRIEPWGWDMALLTLLTEARITAPTMPDEQQVTAIRRLAGREHTADALAYIRKGIEHATCGESRYVTTETERCDGSCVIKAPWSSSGRGIRYVMAGEPLSDNTRRWMTNVIRRQGGITVEPYYPKVKDFAMEFEMEGQRARYLGLSLFITTNGAYAGNLLATEEEKRRRLSAFLPSDLLQTVRQRICSYAESHYAGVYEGPFGVDMMVVATDGAQGFLLHPCVEINLRRTMGHVALALPTDDTIPERVMHLVHDVNFRLKTTTIHNDFVQTL